MRIDITPVRAGSKKYRRWGKWGAADPLETSNYIPDDARAAVPLRVALVTQEYQVGGAERQVELIAGLLAARLGACDIVSTGSAGRGGNPVAVRIHRLGARRKHLLWRTLNFLAAFRFFAWHGQRYSIVHGYCLSSLVLGALLGSRLRGCRTVVRVCTVGPQGDVAKIKRRRFGAVIWRRFLQADAFMVMTPSMAVALQSDGVPAGKIELLPNAAAVADVDALSPAVRPAARAALHLPERPTVLWMGRWVAQKRVELLLRAWRILASTDVTLLLVGDGPEGPRIAEWVRHTECTESVRLFGWQSQPERFYRAADIFVFTASHEAYGNAVAEAMAQGLAVITTPTGLVPDWIAHDVNGIILGSDTPQELAEALAQLLGDAARRERLGRAARQTAAQAFGSERILDALLAFYTRLVQPRRRPRTGVERAK